MKQKFKIFSLMLLTISLCASFNSCSDNDDDGPLSDPAKAIAGTYVGTGKLGLAGLTGVAAETYPGMKMVVSRSSNEYVLVTPYHADGKPFFGNGDTGSVYQITQSANGDFKLTSNEASRAQLYISRNGHMEYDYPYVSVGGESGYSLMFTGDKQ